MRAMKDSGVEWIGEIPEEWSLLPVKRFFQSVKRVAGSDAGKYERLALTMSGVIKRSKDDNEGLQPEKFEGYQVLKENELVFKLIDLENTKTSRVGISSYTGLVSPAYIVLTNRELCNRYFYYFFMFMYHNEVFNHLGGDGVRSALNAYDVLSLPMIRNERSTRYRVATFLDEKCSKIDAIIVRQQEAIEKLKEYKQSVITEAVTKGLDPTVPMKDSEIEWIGKIPQHWNCTTIARVSTVVRGASPRPAGDPRYFNGQDVHWITVAEVTKGNDKYLYDTESFLTNEGAGRSRFVEPGTLLLSNSGATLGVPKILRISGCINDGSVAFYDLQIDQNYLYYIFMSRTYELRKQMQGYGQPNLNTTIVKEIDIPQPNLEEQNTISNHLDTKCMQVENTIRIKQSLITKLTEYKKSLIYEAVTGKMEV